jgi:hypothetical protein
LASRSELALALEHARERTEALLEPLSDDELTRQVSPLQSPLVWDLAHIGHFEELWHTVSIPRLELEVAFEEGEPLRVEISAKFRRERFALEAGLRLDAWWTRPSG